MRERERERGDEIEMRPGQRKKQRKAKNFASILQRLRLIQPKS